MVYNCVLYVYYWDINKIDSVSIPDYFEADFANFVWSGHYKTEKYVSKKYHSLEEMVSDYHKAILQTKQKARPIFFHNTQPIEMAYQIYEDYLKRLTTKSNGDEGHVCRPSPVQINTVYNIST